MVLLRNACSAATESLGDLLLSFGVALRTLVSIRCLRRSDDHFQLSCVDAVSPSDVRIPWMVCRPTWPLRPEVVLSVTSTLSDGIPRAQENV